MTKIWEWNDQNIGSYAQRNSGKTNIDEMQKSNNSYRPINDN